MDDEELLELVELEVRELLSHLRLPRRRDPDHPGHRPWRRLESTSKDPERAGVRADSGADAGGGRLRADAGAGDRPAVPDADRRCVRDQGAGHGGDRADRAGRVKTGDEIEIVGLGERRKVVVTGVEMFQKTLDEGEAGDNVGCLLRGVERAEMRAGAGACANRAASSRTPSSRPRSMCWARRRGGGTRPFFPGYRPQFYIRTTDVTGTIALPEGVEMVMPGDNIQMGVELITPVAIEEGLRFAIREGGRTVGAGVVTRIVE